MAVKTRPLKIDPRTIAFRCPPLVRYAPYAVAYEPNAGSRMNSAHQLCSYTMPMFCSMMITPKAMRATPPTKAPPPA